MQNKSLLLLMSILLLWCGQTFASGFAIIEQSVSGLGNAFAGGAASAEDASTVYYNPAGMMLLDGSQATAGVHYIMPSVKFKSEQDANVLGGDLGSDNGGQAGITKIVPNLYYSNRISDKLAFGLGINAPFGLSTEYDKTWVGRYHAVDSEVVTININPSVAFKLTDKLSFGVGLNAQYMEATLSSMVDGGLVNASLASRYASGDITPVTSMADFAMAADPTNISNTQNDILAENEADDWSYGFNLGLMYEFSKDTRLGAMYRSEIKHKLKGEVKTTVPTSMEHLAVLFAEQDINGTVTLPAMAGVSVFHQLTEKLAIMADITWTQWSSFDELTINFEGTGIADSSSTTTTENWDDTWRYSVGATYQATEDLLLRIGTAYDETPISDEYRTPRIPGEDRIWLSFGAGYKILDNLVIDAAYTHLFVKDSKMEKYATPDTEDESRGTVIGEFENAVDIASIQLTYNF